jgi:hypothetical protein
MDELTNNKLYQELVDAPDGVLVSELKARPLDMDETHTVVIAGLLDEDAPQDRYRLKSFNIYGGADEREFRIQYDTALVRHYFAIEEAYKALAEDMAHLERDYMRARPALSEDQS